MSSERARPFGETTISRRGLLSGLTISVCMFRAEASPVYFAAQDRRGASLPMAGHLDWDGFVKTAVDRATGVVAGSEVDEHIYIEELQQLLRDLRQIPEPKTHRSPTESFAIDWAYQVFPLGIITIEMAPGAVIPHHDHRQYNAALRVVAGDVHISNFEIVDAAAALKPDATFRIRNKRTEHLIKGQTSGLCRTGDNIHCLQAGDGGATLIDCLTQYELNPRSVYLEMDQPDRSIHARELRVRWC